jgi:hypothetical protein
MIYIDQAGPHPDGQMCTLYIGTKEGLVNAGIATPSMLPQSGTYSKSNTQSHPESGKWELRCIKSDLDIWQICYHHDIVVSPEELSEMRERAVIEIYGEYMGGKPQKSK